MDILYYTWDELTTENALEAFERLGHNIHIADNPLTDYDYDPAFTSLINKTIERHGAKAIFTFNYLPILSISAEAYDIPYISWIFDMPHNTLLSPLANKSCNHIFIFDHVYADQIAAIHPSANIYHMPLAANTLRQSRQPNAPSKHAAGWSHDISFIGSLYEHNMYDKITFLPDRLRGYIEGIMQAQQNIYGYNLIGSSLTPEIVTELEKYVQLGIPADYLGTSRTFYEEFINKKLSSLDRSRLLNCIAHQFSLSLFTSSDHKSIKDAHFMGIVDYFTEMPQVFCSSKINLNITIRSIVSGIPLRAMDIMGAGGFLLSNYQPELDAYFIEGEDMAMFDSEEDLLGKAEYYLSHEKERMDIAQNGLQKVHSAFTYDIQLSKILSSCFSDD